MTPWHDHDVDPLALADSTVDRCPCCGAWRYRGHCTTESAAVTSDRQDSEASGRAVAVRLLGDGTPQQPGREAYGRRDLLDQGAAS